MKHLLENRIKLKPVIKRYGIAFQLIVAGSLLFLSIGNGFAQEKQLQFQLPIDCKIGKTCFLQSYADLDPGPGILDPLCGQATYDGHKGTDIRLKTIPEISQNVAVLAAADGVVKGVRNTMADKLMRTNEDRQAVKGKECGNGVLIDHGNGYESQYCHMRRGSVLVEKDQTVKAGEPIGYVGLSGLTQFPHIHFTVRKDGKWIDAVSGLAPNKSCATDGIENSLFVEGIEVSLTDEPTQILDAGISGQVIQHSNLVETGGPASAKRGDNAIVGWAWFINVRKDDRIDMRLDGPNGLVSSNLTEPFDRHKAAWSGFVGRKRNPVPGNYTFNAKVIRDDRIVREITTQITVD